MDVRFLKEERSIIDSRGTRDQGELPPEKRQQKSLFFPEPRASFDDLWLFSGGDLVCWAEWTVRKLQYGYHRLYYVRGGRAWYITDGKRYALKQGHLYLFPAYPHCYGIEHDPKEPLNVLWCHFELHPGLVNDLIEFDPAGDEQIMTALRLWADVTGLEKPGNELYHIVSLLLHLLGRSVPFAYTDHPFGEVEKYIDRHLSEKMTVETLAARFGYSRAYFTREFTKAYKMSPGTYLKILRMSRATEMLRSGLSVDDVCSGMGYSDKKVFFRAFKAYHGVTTTEFLENNRTGP